jgi:hypothetical protein
VALALAPSGQESVSVETALPDLRNTTIRQFATALSNESLRAVWEVTGSAAEDQATVTIGSSFALPGNIFNGVTSVRELSCHLPEAARELVFTRAQISWAHGLQTQTPPVLRVSAAMVAALAPAARRLDPNIVELFVLRTSRGTSATGRE